MRSRDVFKCWPFPAGDATANEVRSWLPPMTVPNFRRSSDELNKLRSNRAAAGEPKNEETAAPRESSKSERSWSEDSSEEEEEEKLENPPAEEAVSRLDDSERESEKEEEKLEMVCPVCGDFNAATLTAVNAHIDGCLREERRQQMMRSKSKSKAPKKKRSIAEIFDVEEEEQEQEENPQEQQHERSEIETAMNLWPFGEDVSVTVAKFRWLSWRLEELRSSSAAGSAIGRESARSDEGKTNSVEEDTWSPEEEEKSEMVCPVCRVFKAATVTAANAHIDGCLAHAMRKERWQMRKKLCSNLKPKPPKKRSIAEILTVAPQIEAGNSDVAVEAREEEDDDDGDEDNRERVAIKSKKNTFKNAGKKKKKKKMVKKVMKKKSKVIKLGGVVVPLNNESKKMKKKTTTKKKKRKKKKTLLNNELAATKVRYVYMWFTFHEIAEVDRYSRMHASSSLILS